MEHKQRHAGRRPHAQPGTRGGLALGPSLIVQAKYRSALERLCVVPPEVLADDLERVAVDLAERLLGDAVSDVEVAPAVDRLPTARRATPILVGVGIVQLSKPMRSRSRP